MFFPQINCLKLKSNLELCQQLFYIFRFCIVGKKFEIHLAIHQYIFFSREIYDRRLLLDNRNKSSFYFFKNIKIYFFSPKLIIFRNILQYNLLLFLNYNCFMYYYNKSFYKGYNYENISNRCTSR